MPNSKFFLVKTDKEKLRNSEILKRPMLLKFQTECHESCFSISSGSHSHNDPKEDNKDPAKEDEEHPQCRVVMSKESDSEADTSSSREQHTEVEDEDNDGFKTPTSSVQRIPVGKQCPPAPKKPKPSLKRKTFYTPCNCRHPLDLPKDVELLLPTQHNTLFHSPQSTKKVLKE